MDNRKFYNGRRAIGTTEVQRFNGATTVVEFGTCAELNFIHRRHEIESSLLLKVYYERLCFEQSVFRQIIIPKENLDLLECTKCNIKLSDQQPIAKFSEQ